MAQDATKTILTLGIVGIGGYVAYEYMQYQTGISNLNKADPSGAASAAVQTILPFTTWLLQVKLNFSTVNNLTAQQSSALAALEHAMAGNVVMPPTTTPGTTPTMGASQMPTSVSTVPTTTPTTAPSTGPTVSQPTSADLQHAINMTLANADQWDYAYRELTGAGIDQVYSFNFDTVYGAVVGGTRSSGQMSAQSFLNAPTIAGFKPTSDVVPPHVVHPFHRSGLGAIAHFYTTPVTRSSGSMVYSAQHPSPYRQGNLNMSGFTQPTGFEMALLGRQTLRGNKLI